MEESGKARSSEVSHELWYCSGLVEASLFRTLDAIFTSTLGGAGFSCCGCIGDSMKQQGHFTSLQLKSRKQWTKQSVKPVLYMIASEVDTVR
ncbi:hypothetical protein EMCRGX_G003886 [Ephydatia muelleri]